MLKTVLATLLAAAALAACSSVSDLAVVHTMDLADGSRTYRAECHGLLASTQACVQAAARICGNQPVQTLVRSQVLGDPAGKLDDPRILTFRCGEPAKVEPVAAAEIDTRKPVDVPKAMVLSTDVLFAFDRGDVNAIRPAGRAQLDELVSRLSDSAVKRISIVGYTDRLGADAYNAHLAGQRADAVKQYLQRKGVKADIDASSFGPATPGTACVMRDREALISCLAPDRRVEIRFGEGK